MHKTDLLPKDRVKSTVRRRRSCELSGYAGDLQDRERLLSLRSGCQRRTSPATAAHLEALHRIWRLLPDVVPVQGHQASHLKEPQGAAKRSPRRPQRDLHLTAATLYSHSAGLASLQMVAQQAGKNQSCAVIQS